MPSSRLITARQGLPSLGRPCARTTISDCAAHPWWGANERCSCQLSVLAVAGGRLELVVSWAGVLVHLRASPSAYLRSARSKSTSTAAIRLLPGARDTAVLGGVTTFNRRRTWANGPMQFRGSVLAGLGGTRR